MVTFGCPREIKKRLSARGASLGSAGFLAGKRATTHPNAFEELKPYCATVVVDHRVVDEEGVVTRKESHRPLIWTLPC